MKILCKVNKKAALIVGFAQGHKSKTFAVVICEGKMQSVALKDIELNELPEALSPLTAPVPIRKREAG